MARARVSKNITASEKIEDEIQKKLSTGVDILSITHKSDQQFLGKWVLSTQIVGAREADLETFDVVCVYEGWVLERSTRNAITLQELKADFKPFRDVYGAPKPDPKKSINKYKKQTPKPVVETVESESVTLEQNIVEEQISQEQINEKPMILAREEMYPKPDLPEMPKPVLDSATQMVLSAINNSRGKGETSTVESSINIPLPFDIDKIWDVCNLMGVEYVKVVDAIMNNTDIVDAELLKSIFLNALMESAKGKKS